MIARFKPDSPLVSAEWLLTHLAAPDVRVLDATWFMPDTDQLGKDAYDAQHIPGARFFDIDEIADTDSPLPHMLPAPEKFASRARKLGLGDGHRIICYDQNGYFAAARAWWMFRLMGHEDVAVLDGGFDAWRNAGGEVEDLPPLYAADRHFTVRFRSDLIRDKARIAEISQNGEAQIVDARSAARFKGEVDEPRPGLRRGHIPGSINVPTSSVIDAKGFIKNEAELKKVFADAGVALDKPIINTCGSGVSAAVIALAQAIAGNDSTGLYDGSWTEWGAEGSETPVETG